MEHVKKRLLVTVFMGVIQTERVEKNMNTTLILQEPVKRMQNAKTTKEVFVTAQLAINVH